MITLIAAIDEQGGLGFEGKLPWPHLKEDLRRFRQVTLGQDVVMGRKTFDALESPLPKRTNIVLTRQADWEHEGVKTLPGVLDVINLYRDKQVFFIGGAEIYNQSLPFAERILLTRVKGSFKVDVTWQPNLTGWILVHQEDWVEDGEVVCTFEEYRRDYNLLSPAMTALIQECLSSKDSPETVFENWKSGNNGRIITNEDIDRTYSIFFRSPVTKT